MHACQYVILGRLENVKELLMSILVRMLRTELHAENSRTRERGNGASYRAVRVEGHSECGVQT